MIVLLPFSYHPLVSFGQVAGVHIDGSLLYVTASIATLASLSIIWTYRRELSRNTSFILLTLFLIYGIVSVLWSENTFRSIITVGFFGLLVILVASTAAQWPNIIRRHARNIYILTASTISLSLIWALWQVLGDAIGVSNSLTLLPPNYQSTVFGVARPTGFALEPQFFASILLVPLLWLAWQHLTLPKPDKNTSIFLAGGFIATASILLLTLSRGGIYAALLGLIIVVILKRPEAKRLLSLALYLFISIIVSATIIFVAASINQRDTTSGYTSLSKSLNQLSLGTLSLPVPAKSESPRHTVPPAKRPTNGYVASSTESRTSMSRQAISLWAQNPRSILLGVGIGSFGASLHAANSAFPIGSVVNNYYLELLVETGIIGLGLFIAFVVSLIYSLLKRRHYFLVALLAGLLMQLSFFSGNANIIHLWVIVGIAIAALIPQPKSRLHLVQ